MKLKCIRIGLLVLTFTNIFYSLKAQPKKNTQSEDVTFKQHPADANAIFGKNSPVNYDIEISNGLGTAQSGRLSYQIADFEGRKLSESAVPVNLNAHTAKTIRLAMPAQKAGFYRVSFMINVTDYDDTIRRVFGVDTGAIRSEHPRPTDFDSFWNSTRAELAAVAPQYKVTEMPKLAKANDLVYLVEMRSLDNILVRGWLTLPKNRKPGQKLPVAVGLPGYGDNLQPRHGADGLAFLQINVRGQGNSRDVIHPARNEFINQGIENKNNFVFRGMIMDCVRALDFIQSRPELDVNSVETVGGSMGAYLAMVVAALDSRVALCEADNPGYTDMRSLITTSKLFPITNIIEYSQQRHIPMSTIMGVWDYFDLKNFAPNIKCPTVIGIGLLDPFIPPAAEFATYNNMAGNKKLFIYPDLTHEVGPEVAEYAGMSFYRNFRVVERIQEFEKSQALEQEKQESSTVDVILMKEHPANKNAIYAAGTPLSYTLDLKSTFNGPQQGTVSYIVSTNTDKVLEQHSVPVSLAAQEAKTVALSIPSPGSGFFKVKFAVNVNDYDDTIRRAFGVDTASVTDRKSRPADFDLFWQNASRELEGVPGGFRMVENPRLSKGNDQVYDIEMRSIGNIVIRGYFTLPKNRKPNQKFPVTLYLPGYGAEAYPGASSNAMAVLSLSVRGQNHSNDVINPTREEFITYGIADKNSYILRGALMDCKRLVDFAVSRPEVDSKAIYAAGASMGGYLAMALASIDSRITICSADNPTFADFRELYTLNEGFPMRSIKNFAQQHKLNMPALLNTLDYFDLKNFTPNIRCKLVMGMGMLDNIAPPQTSFLAYHNIKVPGKKLFIFPNLAHEVGPEMGSYVGKWAYAEMNVYQKWKAYNPEAPALDSKELENEPETIYLKEKPRNKEAIFKSGSQIGYSIDLKNNFDTRQKGTFSYTIKSTKGKQVATQTFPLALEPGATKNIQFEAPAQESGFYKIDLTVNTADYDDITRRVFGVDLNNVVADYKRPSDFDEFWTRTKEELAKVEPNFRMTERPDLEEKGEEIYLVEMQSLDNITVRAWLTLPKDRQKHEKFPVFLALPGYGNNVEPLHGQSEFAFIGLNVRGLGNSRDVVHPTRDEYIAYNVEDKDKYIYRGALMDCVRILDFIFSRPEFDKRSIYVTGGSQGGYLTLALASLDHRVTICSAANPGYINLKGDYYKDKWPVSYFKDYAQEKSVDFNKIMDNFDYFDLRNFVSNLQCKVVVGIGLLDPLVPPTNELMMYNEIKSPKKLFVYPNLTHEVPPEYEQYVIKWMTDNLGY